MGITTSTSQNKITNACKKDNLSYLKKNSIINDKNINYYFNLACINEAKSIVQWLSYKSNIIIYEDTLNYIMENKNLDIFILLINRNIIEVNDKIFEKACGYNLDFVKWLLVIKQDLNLKNYNIYVNAFNNYKTKIIKYLFREKISYDFDNDYLFKKACEIKNKKMIKYLQNICKRYDYIEFEDNYQPIIIDKITFLIECENWYELLNEINFKIDNNFKAGECSITLDDSNMVTNCNHHFQFVDIMKWYNKKNLCPFCEKKIILDECIIDSNLLKF